MNADRVVTSPAESAAQGEKEQLGSVVIGLQRTVHDEVATLRIFGRCDDVLAALAQELALEVPPPCQEGNFFSPAVLIGRSESNYIFGDIPYNACGERSSEV